MRSPIGALLNLASVRNEAPIPYLSRRNPSVTLPQVQRGDPVRSMEAMGAVGTLFAIVDRLCVATAMVEWKLWRKAKSGLDEDRQEVQRHAALDLWRKPNPWMTRLLFTEVFQQHLDLVGEAWWVISRHPAFPTVPLEFWPVRPDRMEPVPHPTKYIAGYVYTAPDGEKIPLESRDVIFMRKPNPLDPYRGMGPVQSILADLEANKLAAEWNRNFFHNSAEPGGIIEVDRRLDDDEFDELRTRWAEQHRGVAAAHRVALIEQGMKWVDRKLSQRDMQFVELRSIGRDVVREAYGIPKFVLGDVEDVNRASARESSAFFQQYLVVPRLVRIREVLNHVILPMYDRTSEGLEFDFENPVPPDRQSDNEELTARAEGAAVLVREGFDPEAVLDAVGLPAMDWVGPPGLAVVEAETGVAPEDRPGRSPGKGEPEVEREEVIPADAPSQPGRRRRRRSQRRDRRGRFSYSSHILGLADGDEDEGDEPRQDWEDRLDALLMEWDTVLEAQRGELAEQVADAVENGRPSELAGMRADPARGTELLVTVMLAQAAAAAERMQLAAAAQGVKIDAVAPEGGQVEDLKAAAVISSTMLAHHLAAAAAREAMRLWAPGAVPEDVAQGVMDNLESLSRAPFRVELGAAIWAAENEGRIATLEAAEEAGRGPSYLLAVEREHHSCDPCANIDGKRFNTLSEAQAMYPFGGYVNCEGRARCRGTFEPVWDGDE